MKHLGDITLIKGNEAPVVDCVIGGSPCQDLSLAGKRAGLAGARSGLYMEQIRIIKEMREADANRGKSDVDVRPRYMVWENVPGAFSTNQGKDFAAVLEEAIRVAEPEAPDVHVPEKGWPTSGCFFDEMGKWSVAWRVLDAQFWGTSDKPLPQRRRRIALVADFGGLSAPEILFVRKSVSGNLEPGKPKGKEAAGGAGEGSGGAVPCTLKIRGGCAGGGQGSLNPRG
jgi:DNA (cytosine-5)-methyltransferase 1